MAYKQMTVYAANGKPVNVRQGPGEDQPIITRLPVGTPVFLNVHVGEWAYIRFDSRGGYIMGKYLQDSNQEAAQDGQETPQGGVLYQTVQMARAKLETAQEAVSVAQQAIDAARALLSDAG